MIAVARVELSSVLTSHPAIFRGGAHASLRGHLPATSIRHNNIDSNLHDGMDSTVGAERHLTEGSWMEFVKFMGIVTGDSYSGHSNEHTAAQSTEGKGIAGKVNRQLIMRSEVENESVSPQDDGQSSKQYVSNQQLQQPNDEIEPSTSNINEKGKPAEGDLSSLWLVFIRPNLFRKVVDNIPRKYFVLMITFAVSVGVHFGVGMLFAFHAYLGKSTSIHSLHFIFMFYFHQFVSTMTICLTIIQPSTNKWCHVTFQFVSLLKPL